MKFLEAVLILSGMIIGVGMFGIPYSFVQVGFWLGALELFVIAVAITWLHLLYGEVVLKTPQLHRLPGYVRLHLGERVARLSWASAFFGIVGTLLAYIVVGSIFLHAIFQNVWGGSSEFFWAAAIAALGALVTAFPLKKEALINGVLTSLLIAFIAGFALFLFPGVKAANRAGFNIENLFVPYGVFLFALSGGVVIPDLVTVLGKDRGRVRSAIVVGTLIPAVLYFLFAFAVVGAVGTAASEEAIRGLEPIAGRVAVFLGSMIGFLAVFTSFVVLSSSFQALLSIDSGFSRVLAWLVASGAPFLLYLAGFKNFIAVIGAVGAIAVGIDSALVILMQRRLHRKEGGSFLWFSYAWRTAIFVMIAAGAIFELFRIFG